MCYKLVGVGSALPSPAECAGYITVLYGKPINSTLQISNSALAWFHSYRVIHKLYVAVNRESCTVMCISVLILSLQKFMKPLLSTINH